MDTTFRQWEEELSFLILFYHFGFQYFFRLFTVNNQLQLAELTDQLFAMLYV